MITRDYAVKTLRKALDNEKADFRDGQWEAIDGILHNKRMLVVQRTGWGKSMIYFLAAKFLREENRGMTLLISPLLSLMRNQIESAKRVGIRCMTINSTNDDSWKEIEGEVVADRCDLLLVSPERLSNIDFSSNVLDVISGRIGLLVVDEAHCISDWGHDFRPDYKRISRLINRLPKNMPVLATTATANTRVVNDVKDQLGQSVEIIRGDLVRKSLFLENICMDTQEKRLAWLVSALKGPLAGSGIIYTLTIRDAEIVAKWLRKNGISAYAYYGSVKPCEDCDENIEKRVKADPRWDEDGKNLITIYREILEDMLLGNKIKALVATSALGMGFDKPDLSFVIHYQCPQSVVHYYQQVGRAGRGVDSAYGILLYGGCDDDAIVDYFIRNAFPDEKHVNSVLKVISESYDGMSVPEITRALNMRRSDIEKIIKFVTNEEFPPIVKDGRKYVATMNFRKYAMPRERIERLNSIRHKELDAMKAYCSSKSCLMNQLCEELDTPITNKRCDNCCNCSPISSIPVKVDSDIEMSASDFLNRSYIPILPRKKWGDSNIAASVFGPCKNGYISDGLRMNEGRALVSYNSGPLGRMVRDGKYRDKHFDDKLVDACVKMYREWNPVPKPVWVTSVPSLNNPSLVSDFAERFAEATGLKYVECIRKVKITEPQKNMENSIYQQNNIINAFEVVNPLKEDCLLIDDMVDSKWTVTVIAAMLRKKGVKSVTPMALADSSNLGD